ncbi:MAG: hypothetical protein KGL12_00290 [Rhodospirillales bacterium]|nr:hypothetical protein [Rhodospirillales bacterium]
MEDDDTTPAPPESLLPYDAWTETALRQVVARAIAHAGANGLPGGHHFYLTFRTDDPGTHIPARLRAQYPQEMTIVLQHQFWDLKYDEGAALISVGLSFGGIPSTLIIPLDAVTAFADPEVRFGLRFTYGQDAAAEAPEDAAPEAPAIPADASPEAAETPSEAPQVVSLDAFRRRPRSDS